MCKLWIQAIHGLRCSKNGSVHDLRFAQTIHGLDPDWTNLAQSVDCTTTQGVCITFMAGHARLDCTVISQNTHYALALSKRNLQKSSEDILLLLLLI